MLSSMVSSMALHLWHSETAVPFLRLSARSFFSLEISALRSWMVPLESSLITALFLISLALYANLSVDKVSPWHCVEGEMLAIMRVLLLPPKESLNKKVSLLSR